MVETAALKSKNAAEATRRQRELDARRDKHIAEKKAAREQRVFAALQESAAERRGGETKGEHTSAALLRTTVSLAWSTQDGWGPWSLARISRMLR